MVAVAEQRQKPEEIEERTELTTEDRLAEDKAKFREDLYLVMAARRESEMMRPIRFYEDRTHAAVAAGVLVETGFIRAEVYLRIKEFTRSGE
jgi:hypothetical protein